VAIALRDPVGGAFVRRGADHRGQLGLDQRLVDRLRGLPDPFLDITTLQNFEHLEQGRLVQSHRVKCPFARTIGVVSLTFTRWPPHAWVSTPSRSPTYTTRGDATVWVRGHIGLMAQLDLARRQSQCHLRNMTPASLALAAS
jgi:hypothetical protein